MKARQWQEMKHLSDNEMEAKLRDAQEQLFRMRFRHSATRLKNPLELRDLRRSIARIKTVLHERASAAAKKEKK
ncbi:MAG: 50S ribosomal protein L29 [Elusimicrobia bacterium RIFOXYB2_FULL_49_7]|nr:MAG: 50S ribosomal protein L29 [Elusimicrobia bacterium RIFOXYB2_FULL_49_7]